MSFPQLVKPEIKPPQKPHWLAWLDGYALGVLAGVVIFNVLALPVLASVRPFPGFGWLWWAQLGLAASWMTWSSSPAPIRYASPLLAVVLCAYSAHSLMAWENETLGMFLQFHLPVVAVVHLLLLPTRMFGWRWHFQKHAALATHRSGTQFSLIHSLTVLAAWGALLGYLRWENGGDVLESMLVVGIGALFALMVVPVAWLAIAHHRKWWLVFVVFVILFIAIWNRMPQTDIHQLLDLEFEPLAMIAIWTLINMGLLYLLGLRGSTSLRSVTEPNQALSHV
jgi:hypothetical protein